MVQSSLENYLLLWTIFCFGTTVIHSPTTTDAPPISSILDVYPSTRTADGIPQDPSIAKHEQETRLPNPVFVVGFPKSGTTSLYEMFKCSGVLSSHYCCGSQNDHQPCGTLGTMGVCMQRNLEKGLSILEDCGGYDFYGQMDCERRLDTSEYSMFLPQHFHLEELHEFAPNATLILNLRPAEDWVRSIMNWFGYSTRFLNAFGVDKRNVDKEEALKLIYNNHTRTIRNFAKKYPTHALIEVNITDTNAPSILRESLVFLRNNCWEKRNPSSQNKRLRHKLKNG
jgi:hypothetical protein